MHYVEAGELQIILIIAGLIKSIPLVSYRKVYFYGGADRLVIAVVYDLHL